MKGWINPKTRTGRKITDNRKGCKTEEKNLISFLLMVDYLNTPFAFFRACKVFFKK